MNKIFKKITIILIIFMFLFMDLIKIVNAIVEIDNSNEISNNSLQENNIENEDVNETQENGVNNELLDLQNIREETYDINSFNILQASILDEKNFSLDNIQSILEKKPSEKGLWVVPKDRDFLLKLINSITNSVYKYNENGYLAKDKDKTGSEIKSSYIMYTNKINELINSDNTIILSIDSEYKSLNDYDKEILNMTIEKNEYSLLFNEKDNELNKIAILNFDKYNKNNDFDSLATLMNHFLELFYNNDEQFINYVQDKMIYTQVYVQNVLQMKNINNTEEQYRVALAGILDNKVNNINQIDDILTNKPNKNGLWVAENAREYIILLINNITNIEYRINSEGYLEISNTDNTNEKDYNSIEKSLNEIINGDKKVILDINNFYMEKLDDLDIVEKFNIEKNEYKKILTISDSKVIILNSDLFNINNQDDDAETLISYILEEFEYEHEKIINFSDEQMHVNYSGDNVGNMGSSQNVFAGPSNSNYALVGSVSSGEEVHVLEGEFGWYQIRYETVNGKKVGFVPKESVPNVVRDDRNPAYTEGGLAFSYSGNLDIYYGYPTTDYVKVGTIYEGEGVTFLQKIDNLAYIEYSTSTGTKRGLVEYSKIFIVDKSTVARVNTTSSAYAGPDSDFVKLGGAYYNEYVTILEKRNDWVYVEYNTIKGRKCGYMLASNLDALKSISLYDFSVNDGLKKATQQITVYGGPSTSYANLGLVYSQEVVSFLRNIERVGKEWAYIEYNTINGAKRGYVEAEKLIETKAPPIPNLMAFKNFSTGTYFPYKTSNGNDLRYYTIGNGEHTVFMIYEQHGWEDAWAADGVELTNIASNVMLDLSNFSTENADIFNYWKVYIIPSANPDGITNGYSNNGPGRCTVEEWRKIDMNRSWPANFSPYYTSRNYTGNFSLGRKTEDDYGAGEIRGLKDFIDSNKGDQNIILDIHGWLNQTYGDLGLGRYFSNHFGFKNNGSYGSGYLITYGKSIGAKSCLVELPMPSNVSSIINNNYSGKLAAGFRDLLIGEKGNAEGGENVNETCKIITTTSVNVRERSDTSSNILTTLVNGTIVNRIKKNVANNNGYIWDKIKLADGREGYVVTDYLQVVLTNEILYKLNDSDESIQAIKAYLRYNNINNYNDTPTAILDEDTINTIKIFQGLKGIPQTGNLDRYTIEAMGFSIDSSNRIEDNAYYKQYLQYANNYINYGNASQPTYVEFSQYLDDLGRNNRFVYPSNYTKISPTTQQNISLMENKYNKMPENEKIEKKQELDDIEAKFERVLVLGYVTGKKNSYDSLKRFMENSGKLLIHSNIPDKLKGNSKHYALYKTYVERAKDAAEKFAPEGDKSFVFSLEYEGSAQFGESDYNLWASFGKYRIEMICELKKINDDYKMHIKYYIKDYYDWEERKLKRIWILAIYNN